MAALLCSLGGTYFIVVAGEMLQPQDLVNLSPQSLILLSENLERQNQTLIWHLQHPNQPYQAAKRTAPSLTMSADMPAPQFDASAAATPPQSLRSTSAHHSLAPAPASSAAAPPPVASLLDKLRDAGVMAHAQPAAIHCHHGVGVADAIPAREGQPPG